MVLAANISLATFGSSAISSPEEHDCVYRLVAQQTESVIGLIKWLTIVTIDNSLLSQC